MTSHHTNVNDCFKNNLYSFVRGLKTEDKCRCCRCCLLLMAGCYYFLSWSTSLLLSSSCKGEKMPTSVSVITDTTSQGHLHSRKKYLNHCRVQFSAVCSNTHFYKQPFLCSNLSVTSSRQS